jgi:hypothetical protein
MLGWPGFAVMWGLVFLLSGCSGGSSNPAAPPPAPNSLSYPANEHIAVGVAVDLEPTVTGTVTSYSVSPSLPDGLSLSATRGAITGTPTGTTASVDYTVTAGNSSGSTTAIVTIQVLHSPPSNLSYPAIEYAVAVPVDNAPIVTGVVASYSISPTLPSGLAFDTTTGVISGKPTAMTAAAMYTVTATNNGGSTSTSFAIQVRDSLVGAGLEDGNPGVIEVSATSYYGIAQVSASVQGNSLGTITTPSLNNLYFFDITSLALKSGVYQLTVTTTTDSGVVETFSTAFTVSNPPVLSLSPKSGAIVTGTLAISGTATSDKPGPLTTVVSLNQTTILTTTQNSFSVNMSLAGVAPGLVTISASSTDAQGTTTAFVSNNILVTTNQSEAGLVPVVYGTMYAVEGMNFLYKAADSTMHLNVGGGDVALMDTGPTAVLANWMLADGLAYASGSLPSSLFYQDVYRWSSTGVPKDLCFLASDSDPVHQLISVHDGWAYWSSGSFPNFSLKLFNLSSNQLTAVGSPAGSLIYPAGDFYVAAGQPQLDFTVAPSVNGNLQIVQWDQVTATAMQLTSGSGGGVPKTDRTSWVAWLATGINAYDIATASTTLVPANVNAGSYYLDNGIFAWLDGPDGSTQIKVWNAATNVTSTVSSDSSARPIDVGDGYVIFRDTLGLHAWSPTSGDTLLIEVPALAFISGKVVYFSPVDVDGYWYREVLP